MYPNLSSTFTTSLSYKILNILIHHPLYPFRNKGRNMLHDTYFYMRATVLTNIFFHIREKEREKKEKNVLLFF